MEVDVRAFVRACPTCLKLSQTSFPVASTSLSNTTYSPMTCLNIDIHTIVPLPVDSFVNYYIIVIIDTFTTNVDLYKISDAIALSDTRAFFSIVGATEFLKSCSLTMHV